MTERPIIFSAPMVLAIVEGRKTQTRRVMKPQPFQVDGSWRIDIPARPTGKDVYWWPVSGPANDKLIRHCCYGAPGDRLWVRETWQVVKSDERPPKVWYRADPGVEECVARSLIGWSGWRPARCIRGTMGLAQRQARPRHLDRQPVGLGHRFQETHVTETASPMHGEAASAAPGAVGVRCRACHSIFTPRKHWQHFCSPKCRNAWHSWTRPDAVREARELVRLALEGCDPAAWNPRARRLLGIK